MRINVYLSASVSTDKSSFLSRKGILSIYLPITSRPKMQANFILLWAFIASIHSATAQFYAGCSSPPCYPPWYASYCSVVPNTPLCVSSGNLGGPSHPFGWNGNLMGHHEYHNEHVYPHPMRPPPPSPPPSYQPPYPGPQPYPLPLHPHPPPTQPPGCQAPYPMYPYPMPHYPMPPYHPYPEYPQQPRPPNPPPATKPDECPVSSECKRGDKGEKGEKGEKGDRGEKGEFECKMNK
jgi:hypothetical protein